MFLVIFGCSTLLNTQFYFEAAPFFEIYSVILHLIVQNTDFLLEIAVYFSL